METSSDKSGQKHPIFSCDPVELMQYVSKEVCVLSEDGVTQTGVVYTVDPVSQTVALVQFSPQDTATSLKLIMGHAVQKITVLDEETPESRKQQLERLFWPPRKAADALSAEELRVCKERVKSWLLKNRLPVREGAEAPGVLSVSDALFIEPPYGFENCRSTNEIILGRVQGLMKNMPPDVDDW